MLRPDEFRVNFGRANPHSAACLLQDSSWTLLRDSDGRALTLRNLDVHTNSTAFIDFEK